MTRKHSIEEALRASEERHRAIFENAVAGILLTRPDGSVLAANPAACAILRRTEAEVIAVGRSGIADLTDPRLPGLLTKRNADGKAAGELRMVRGDGTRFEAELASAVFEGPGGVPHTVLVFADITERIAGARALELLADAGKALVAGHQSQQILDALVHLLVPRVAEMAVAEVVHEDRPRELAAAHVDPEKVASLRAPPDLPGARTTLCVPLVGRGRTLGTLWVGNECAPELIREVASRASMVLENAIEHEAAITARRLRDDVLAVVAHDLRSPLNAILLSAQAMARGAPVQSGVEIIVRSMRRAERLIQDLIMVAKLEAHAMTLDLRSHSASAIADELLAQFERPAEAAKVQLSASVEPDLQLYVDQHRCLQMLGNLIDNAIKFSVPGGRVELRIAAEAGGAVLAVSDTGKGIPLAQLEKIFDRFWQGAVARRAGSGLGLAIVKGIADAHGGTVSVASEPGKGTTFTVHLSGKPRADPPSG